MTVAELGLLLYKKGRLEEAIMVRQAPELEPSNLSDTAQLVHYALGSTREEKGARGRYGERMSPGGVPR